MYFCKECNNMYYLKMDTTSEQDKLIYYCRNCGDEKHDLETHDYQISQKSNVMYFDGMHLLNQYTKYDKTIPRTQLVTCPNGSCPTMTEQKENEVLLIRYDLKNLKYLFICYHCDHTWKID